jgi:hypothetical protein
VTLYPVRCYLVIHPSYWSHCSAGGFTTLWSLGDHLHIMTWLDWVIVLLGQQIIYNQQNSNIKHWKERGEQEGRRRSSWQFRKTVLGVHNEDCTSQVQSCFIVIRWALPADVSIHVCNGRPLWSSWSYYSTYWHGLFWFVLPHTGP